MMDRIAPISDIHSNLAKNLKSDKYYMYFENDKNRVIAYKNKIFEMALEDNETLEEAINYGINLGIAKKELNFGGK